MTAPSLTKSGCRPSGPTCCKERSMSSIEQLRDIFCGRATYSSDREWLDSVSAELRDLSEKAGLDFEDPVSGGSYIGLVGNLSEGFKVRGPWSSFDAAADALVGVESWIMSVEAE